MSFLTGKECPGKCAHIVDHHVQKKNYVYRIVRKALNAISDKNLPKCTACFS